jgi:hypothetical protein
MPDLNANIWIKDELVELIPNLSTRFAERRRENCGLIRARYDHLGLISFAECFEKKKKGEDNLDKVYKLDSIVPPGVEMKPEYKKLTSRSGFYFLKFVENNLFMPIINEKLLNFISSAQFNGKAVTYTKKQDELTDGFDANGNYSSFKFSPYFESYGLPRSEPCDFYLCDEDQTSSILDKVGWSLIDGVDISDCHDYIRQQETLKDRHCYTNLLLKWMRDHKARFRIIQVAWSNSSTRDVWLPEVYEEYYGDKKESNNKVFGRLCVHSDSTIMESIICKTETELQNTTHWLEGSIVDIKYPNISCGESTFELIYRKTVPTPAKQYPHVRSYILAYAMLAVLDKIVEIEMADILKVKIDAIYTKNPKKYQHLFEPLVARQFGGWKIEKANRVFQEVFVRHYLSKPNQISPEYYDDLPRITPENRDEYLNIPMRLCLVGPAGCGKTTKYIKYFPLFNLTVSCPTNKRTQSEDFKENVESAITNHKQFNKQCFGNTQKFTNHLFDEAGLITPEDFDGYMSDWRIETGRIILTVDPYQLKPVRSDKTILEIPEFHDIFTIIKMDKVYRTDEPEFIKLQEKYRVRKNGRVDLEDFPNRITKSHAIEIYEDGDYIIGSTHRKNDKYNAKLLEKMKDKLIPFINKRRQFVREPYDIYRKYPETRLAYAITFHKIQGDTIEDKKIMISTKNLFDSQMFYVGITRARKASQIYLIV